MANPFGGFTEAQQARRTQKANRAKALARRRAENTRVGRLEKQEADFRRAARASSPGSLGAALKPR